MINSFVFIVDQDTYEVHTTYGFCATGKSKKPLESYDQFLKSDIQCLYHDVMSDLLNIQVGDLIFFYIAQQGFKDVYEVTEKLFFDATSIEKLPASRPFRILIKPKYQFKQSVPEDSLFLSEERRRIFWLLYFNKARGRARACVPLDPDASRELIKLLLKYNSLQYSSFSDVPQKYPGIKREVQTLKFKGGYSKPLNYEDSLSALILLAYQNKSAAFSNLFGSFQEMEWIGNKIPFDISGKNIDLLIYHKKRTNDGEYDLRYKYSVVELKSKTADLAALHQLLIYSQAVGRNLAEQDFHLVQPILIAKSFKEEVIKAVELGFSNHQRPMLVEYDYVENLGLVLKILEHQQNSENSLQKISRFQQYAGSKKYLTKKPKLA